LSKIEKIKLNDGNRAIQSNIASVVAIPQHTHVASLAPSGCFNTNQMEIYLTLEYWTGQESATEI
jgi:hypothetical protein